MAGKPSAPIIDDDMYFRVLQKAGYAGSFLDQRDVTWVDLYNRHVLYDRVIGYDLSPRARGKAYNKHLLWRGVKTCNGVSTENPIRIVHQVGIEVAIVAPTAIDRFLGIDGYHTAPIFDEISKAGPTIVFALVEEPFVYSREEWPGRSGEDHKK